MSRDKLFLLQPGFEDPSQPGQFFVCPHCNAIEGLLGSFPVLAARIEVQRLPFSRPRIGVVELLGEAYQSLPVLVFADGNDAPDDAETANGKRFVGSTTRILELLAERFGFPQLHQ
jgi:hypothetical protein